MGAGRAGTIPAGATTIAPVAGMTGAVGTLRTGVGLIEDPTGRPTRAMSRVSGIAIRLDLHPIIDDPTASWSHHGEQANGLLTMPGPRGLSVQ